MSDLPKLLPCPFCGNELYIREVTMPDAQAIVAELRQIQHAADEQGARHKFEPKKVWGQAADLIDRLTRELEEARAVEPNDTTLEAVSRALARCAWVRSNARDSAFARMKYPHGESQYVNERHHIYRDDARAAITVALSKKDEATQ